MTENEDLIERAARAVNTCRDHAGNVSALTQVLADVEHQGARAPRTLPSHVWPDGRPPVDEYERRPRP
ncbi:hypothetical protein GCM10027414_00750 [Humibacter ginsengiterrae]